MKPEEAAKAPWCTCMGTCLGCEIEKKVRESYGKMGLAFLKAHIKDD